MLDSKSEVSSESVADAGSDVPETTASPAEADVTAVGGPDVGDADQGNAGEGNVGEGMADGGAEPARDDATAATVQPAIGLPTTGQPATGQPPTRQPPSADQLVEEGEIAADYLEELLDIADVDGDIDIDVENGRASVAVLSEGASTKQLRRFVGEDGDVLEALQELTRLAVQAHTGVRSRLMLDVAGHRAARRQELVVLAKEAAAKVRADGRPLRLEPMSPFERKVVHDTIAESGLASESEGVAPDRRVVVLPVAGT